MSTGARQPFGDNSSVGLTKLPAALFDENIKPAMRGDGGSDRFLDRRIVADVGYFREDSDALRPQFRGGFVELSSRRPQIVTFEPRRPSFMAIEKPIPVPPPVMRDDLPFSTDPAQKLDP